MHLTTDDQDTSTFWRRSRSILARPHPFIEAGNREFNSLVWLRPTAHRAGDVLVADSTVFSTLFGGTESLEQFWKNLALAK